MRKDWSFLSFINFSFSFGNRDLLFSFGNRCKTKVNVMGKNSPARGLTAAGDLNWNSCISSEREKDSTAKEKK